MSGMGRITRRGLAAVVTIAMAVGVLATGTPVGAGASTRCHNAACTLGRAVRALVLAPGGPPGVIVVVQRGKVVSTVSAGVAEAGTSRPIGLDDHMRLASVSKAFSGAAALALVSSGRLSLADTVGRRLPGLPGAWRSITLAELLNHTSGIPDFSQQPAFQQDLIEHLLDPPAPYGLLRSVLKEPLRFTPGSRYEYSNSDNIVVGLMIEAATGRSYEDELASTVFGPLGLHRTGLPRNQFLPLPEVHGYAVDPPAPPDDVTNLFAAGWTWASGGVTSTPADANRFIRAYASGATVTAAVHRAQFRFVPGDSEPPGPGTNAAGLGIFRYSTRCGTVYGHTGNTAGYTQFIAASADGRRSVVVSVNAQITPKTDAALFTRLRALYVTGVCAALS